MRAWLRTADGRAVAVLLAVPALAFVVPALFGIPALSGDNLIQNFPLRAFAGELLRHGHLPLWNPYIWSGSPLLGGMNAGALYPFTFLFVFLPPIGAWVLNLLVVYWSGALGTYWLTRQLGARPLAGFLAAAVYAFAGTMVGQMVHLGIVQGMGLMPIIVLAVLKISWGVVGQGPATRRLRAAAGGGDDVELAAHQSSDIDPAATGVPASVLPWVVFLAVLVGLIMLTGEPRSIAETEIVVLVLVVWDALRAYRDVVVTWATRARFVVLCAVAGLWGVAIGAVQLLPGYHFIHLSQRANEPYSFFASGSLHTQWTALLLVPDLFGGSGSVFHQVPYFNQYNLPEVTGYVGLLPLVAAFALATRAFGRHRDPTARDWTVWLALAVLGLIFAWGEYTPVGGLIGHIPLFGSTRLQSRNIGITDLALAVLLAFWVERGLSRRQEWLGTIGWRRFVAAAPPVAALILCVVAIAVPGPLEAAFGADGNGRGLTPWFVAQLVVALLATLVVLGWSHLRAAPHRWLVVGVVVVDVVLFGLSSATGFDSQPGSITEPTPATAAAVLGTGGRFAFYGTNATSQQLGELGQPDLNVFTKLGSVQGYGSIVDNDYGEATGAHYIDALSPCALAEGVFTPLRLSTLLTSSRELAPEVVPGASLPSAPAACPGAPAPGTARQRTWYFGQPLTLASASLDLTSSAAAGTPPTVGVLGPDGRVRFPSTTTVCRASRCTVTFGQPVPAVGLVVRGSPRTVADTSQVAATDGQHYVLDGALQAALGQTGWRFTGMWHTDARFQRTAVPPPVWVQGGPAGARAHQVSTTDYGQEVDRVTTSSPALVVRSESNLPGWRVTATPVGGGAARTLSIRSVGLIQGVEVPAGSWLLTFDYRAPGLSLGLVGTAVGVVALVVALVVLWRRRSRRSVRRPAHAAGSTPTR